MNSPLKAYLADLASRTAMDISLVNDNARIHHTPRRESRPITSPRLCRWDSMGSTNSIKEMTLIAPIRAKSFSNKAIHLRRPISRRNCTWRCDTDKVLLRYLISHLRLDLSYWAPPPPKSMADEDFDIQRALDDITFACDEDSFQKEKLEKQCYRTNMSSSWKNASLLIRI
jgi:hypothetical protein